MFSTLKNNSVAILASGLITLGVLGCGKLSPDAGKNQKLNAGDKNRDNLDLTGLPNDSAIGFSLEDGSKTDVLGRTFAGALVLWDPNITGAGFADLFSKTKAYNAEVLKSQQEFVQFEKITLLPGIQRYRQLADGFSAQKSAQRGVIDTEQSARASNWLQTQRDEFAPELTSVAIDIIPAFVAHFDGVIDAYCEAQILRFGLSSVAAKGSFWKRPSPQAMCETRYTQMQFFQGELCSPVGSDSIGKNYWACIWQEGVLKTRFWKLLPLQTQQNLSVTLASSQGQTLFGASKLDAADACSPLVIRNSILKLEGTLSCPLLHKDTLNLAMTQSDINGIETAVGADKRNKTLETVSADRAHFVIGNFVANAGRTIPQASFPDALRLLPDNLALPNGAIGVIQTNQRVSLANRLKLLVNWMSEGGCSEDLRSPNDSIYNSVRLANLDSLKPCPTVGGVSAALPNIEFKASAEAGVQTPADFIASLTSARAGFCLLKSAGACADPVLAATNTTCRIEKKSQEKLLAVRSPGVSQGFFREVKFSFGKDNLGEDKLTIAFSNNQSFEVPFDLSRKNIGKWTGNQNIESRINATTGALEMRIPLRAALFASDNFSTEDSADIKGYDKFLGQTLELELFSNALGGIRPYLSGKLFIKDSKGNTLAQGVASYLLDSSFDDKVSRICGANLESWAPGQ